ncbi:MAG: metallophosphoesterase [Desulfamplus sp.]|nr:metallophosphoesterase [Desulfamplus sp.]MBF0388824.1 metallophosphoesterase [Desulfamplus sp.]
MKILSVSDVVAPALYKEFDKELFSNIDLVLSCGDLPPEYLSFILHALNVPLFYVRGNHDIRYNNKPPMGCTDIHSRIVKFNNIKIMGLGGSRWYNGGENQYTEEQMKKIVSRMKLSIWLNKGVDIVISHASPRYIHDAEDRCHRGFKVFHKVIDKYKPAYFIHGHIHKNFNSPDDRITTINTTKVINTYGYNIIEINDGKAA